MNDKRPCPCHSGRRYGECCAPAHRGLEASTPEALMRSRYAAFALGLNDYLVKTLARAHPERDRPWTVPSGRRFAGLRILATSVDGDRGEVRFHAKIYDHGRDASFTERSQFVREDGAWRYASGEIE